MVAAVGLPQPQFFGSIEGPRLGALYRAADVFVFPSVTDTFGLVIAEALAAGTPFACYPTSGAREIFAGG
jgi:glycosyltransferase involved in cell wall biosynthesis